MAWFLSAAAAIGSYTMQKAQGKMMEAVAKANANALEVQAGQERAAAQYNAELKRREHAIQLGDTKASLAGAGFAGNDVTAATVVGKTVEEQTLAEILMIKQGEQRALGMEAQARQERWEGHMKKKAANMQATVDLVKAGADWWNTYGSGVTKGMGSG